MRCTISFASALSGRLLLLKVWIALEPLAVLSMLLMLRRMVVLLLLLLLLLHEPLHLHLHLNLLLLVLLKGRD